MQTRQGNRTRLKIIWHSALCLILLIAGAIIAQPAGQQTIPNQINQQQHTPFEGMADRDRDRDPLFVARQLRALNVERQKSMVSDTEKLLKLVTELNNEIETSNPSALTPVQLRKISDIEKLARNVRQKMSISYTGGPSFDEPIPQQTR